MIRPGKERIRYRIITRRLDKHVLDGDAKVHEHGGRRRRLEDYRAARVEELWHVRGARGQCENLRLRRRRRCPNFRRCFAPRGDEWELLSRRRRRAAAQNENRIPRLGFRLVERDGRGCSLREYERQEAHHWARAAASGAPLFRATASQFSARAHVARASTRIATSATARPTCIAPSAHSTSQPTARLHEFLARTTNAGESVRLRNA
mmetsp:Transcript_2023/g.6128  ORF Transcript_2023/g.6128 Transcript_2023/m.6128 type:complete len:207 (+) Transcript_2023:154-774(+)